MKIQILEYYYILFYFTGLEIQVSIINIGSHAVHYSFILNPNLLIIIQAVS